MPRRARRTPTPPFEMTVGPQGPAGRPKIGRATRGRSLEPLIGLTVHLRDALPGRSDSRPVNASVFVERVGAMSSVAWAGSCCRIGVHPSLTSGTNPAERQIRAATVID